MSDYDRIRTKLDLLREKDKDLTLFGADDHNYEVSPPLTESQIQEFETKHQIRLPEDYRGFLLTVGNGGAGPYYGLFQLHETIKPKYLEHDPNYPASPFPLTSPLDLIYECTGKRLSIKEHSDEFWELIKDEDFSRNLSACISQYSVFDLRCGTLSLSTFGCGIIFLLVVSGDAYGQIWVDDLINDVGVFPLGVNFITWYEKWLDQSLVTAEIERSKRKVLGYLEFGITSITDWNS